MSLSNIDYVDKKEVQNWAGNITYSANRIYYPKSIKEIQILVKSLDKVKVLATGHTFNGIADTEHSLISTIYFDKVLKLDPHSKTVTFECGITYAKLTQYLHDNGYALHNLSSLPHISVVGAIATATHGSGLHKQNLAAAVTAMEVVDGNGEIVEFSNEKNSNELAGAVVHLGGVGIVTKLTLDIEPAYMMKQKIFLGIDRNEK